MNRKEFISRLSTIGAAVIAAPVIGNSNLAASESSVTGKKIKVGVIGCGSVSGVYLPHLTKCPYTEVVSLCDIKPERPTISIVGSEGNMHMIGYDWKPFGVDMATVQNEKTQRFVTDSKGFQWEEGASVICEYLATGKEPRIDAEHALHVLEIIEATRKSQAGGQRIQLKSTFKWPLV